MPSVIKSLRWPWISCGRSLGALAELERKHAAARESAELHASLPALTPGTWLRLLEVRPRRRLYGAERVCGARWMIRSHQPASVHVFLM